MKTVGVRGLGLDMPVSRTTERGVALSSWPITRRRRTLRAAELDREADAAHGGGDLVRARDAGQIDAQAGRMSGLRIERFIEHLGILGGWCLSRRRADGPGVRDGRA